MSMIASKFTCAVLFKLQMRRTGLIIVFLSSTLVRFGYAMRVLSGTALDVPAQYSAHQHPICAMY